MQSYWTFSLDGEVYDGEWNTSEETQAAAQEHFDAECGSDEGCRNAEREIVLLEFHYDDESERVITIHRKARLYYEYEAAEETPYLQSEFVS